MVFEATLARQSVIIPLRSLAALAAGHPDIFRGTFREHLNVCGEDCCFKSYLGERCWTFGKRNAARSLT